MLDTTLPPNVAAAGKALLHLRKSLARAGLRSGLSQDPDLNVRQEAVLLHLAFSPGPHECRMLSLDLATSRPSIVRAVDALEQLGYVRRDYNQSDRRVPAYQLTAAGAQVAKLIAETLAAALEQRASA